MEIVSRTCALVLVVLTVSWPAAAQTPMGEAFTVNTTDAGDKGSPDVAVAPDGRFAVVWRSMGQDGDGWGVSGRWYDRSGAALTGEVQVNSVAAGHQLLHQIDNNGQGHSVIVWEDGTRGVVFRRFDSVGVPLSDEVVAGSSVGAIDAAVSANAGGSFVVVWIRADSSTRHVEAQRYAADGLPLGDTFTATSFPHGWFPEEAAVVLRDDGSFLVGWSDGAEVHGRLYDAAGTPTAGGFQLSQLDPMSIFSLQLDAGCDDDGRYRVFWATDINLEEVAPMTRTVTDWGALGALTQLDFPSHGRLGYSMTGGGEFIVTRNWGWGDELEGACFDSQHSMRSSFDIAHYAGPGLTLRNGTLAHGGPDSRDFVAVWVNEPLPGGPPFPDIRARRFRMGLFADGFESGDTSAWSVSR
jgi:hypothetical protein